MNTKQAITSTMDMSLFVLKTYLSDLTDAELLQRPAPGCNHLAWQLGHLISSNVSLLNGICPGKAPELPAGFAEQHSKETTGNSEARQFRTKQEYIDLFAKVRDATAAAIDSLSDADLDQPAPEWLRKVFPTVGSVFILIATHPLTHAGQFVVVRRQLGKPVLI